ncbi:hypothetical protein PSV08DRAFT_40075 [Bipolaris maydis]|uniref:uncharacterized protein n=1 Tax=Cochliobolus heterostrophus TaxID=5016 RepID=UPI0024DCFB5F|nr:hypothetical protein J3E73DRAFT_43769 [Bipolaris maydis]KAJ6271449.1 hypothetical protein PSV08DRAFT_40075 [Bipolaris maydis]KAJ6282491.1 hypothetical protein J3E71DRAFT_38491 [Bipolaris maydis]
MQVFNFSSLPLGVVFQAWTMCSIGIAAIMLRIFSRWRHIRRLDLFAVDDWIMMTVVPILYTGLAVISTSTTTRDGSSVFAPKNVGAYTQDDSNKWIEESTAIAVAEQCMHNLMSALKLCMLLTFARTLKETAATKWAKGAAVYIIVGWLAVEVTFFTVCSTVEEFAIAHAIFNLSSDAFIVAIAISLTTSLSLPVTQKTRLVMLFGMGSFIVISALLAKFHDFTGAHSITRIPWYTREASFAVCVANALEIWCLFRRNMSFVHDTAQSHVQCSEAPQDEKVYTNKNNHHGHAHTFQIPSPDDLEYEEASHSDQEKQITNQGEANPWRRIIVDVQVDFKVEILNARCMGSSLEAEESRIVTCEGPDARHGKDWYGRFV